MISNLVIPRAAWPSGSDQAPKVISPVSRSRPLSSCAGRDGGLADAADSKSAGLRAMGVQVSFPAPNSHTVQLHAQRDGRSLRVDRLILLVGALEVLDLAVLKVPDPSVHLVNHIIVVGH